MDAPDTPFQPGQDTDVTVVAVDATEDTVTVDLLTAGGAVGTVRFRIVDLDDHSWAYWQMCRARDTGTVLTYVCDPTGHVTLHDPATVTRGL